MKRGAIIPTGPEIWHIDTEVHPDPLTLDIYPLKSGTSQFIMHDDDGESNDYTRGKYSKTVFEVAKKIDFISVSVGKSDGEYVGKPTERDYILKINLLDTSYNAVALNDTQLRYHADFTTLLGEDGTAGYWAIDAESNILYARFNTSLDIDNSVVVTAGILKGSSELSSSSTELSSSTESSYDLGDESCECIGFSSNDKESSDNERSDEIPLSDDYDSSSDDADTSPLFGIDRTIKGYHTVVSLYTDVIMTIESTHAIVEMYTLTGERIVSASAEHGSLLINSLTHYNGVAYVVVRPY